MKKISGLIIIVIVLFTGYAKAEICFASRCTINDRVYTHSFNYDGAEYRTFFTQDQIDDFEGKDISEIELPKTLDEIIDIAKTEVSKLNKNADWKINSITIDGYNCYNSKFWFYRINFRESDCGYVTVIVTLDGKPGKMVELKEVPVE